MPFEKHSALWHLNEADPALRDILKMTVQGPKVSYQVWLEIREKVYFVMNRVKDAEIQLKRSGMTASETYLEAE